MKNRIVAVVILFLFGIGTRAIAQADDSTVASTDNAQLFSNNPTVRIVAVHPNPATEKLLIEFTAYNECDEVLLRVRNADGKVILRRDLVALKGGNLVILPVATLPPGEYTVQLDEGRRVRSVHWQKM